MSTAVAQNVINFSCPTHLHGRDAGIANLPPPHRTEHPLTWPWVAPARAGAVRQESCRERGSLREPGAVEFWREGKSPIAARKWLSCQHGAMGTPSPPQSTRHTDGPLFASGRTLAPGACSAQDSVKVTPPASAGARTQPRSSHCKAQAVPTAQQVLCLFE